MSRKRVPLNQNECTDDFRIGVPFEQNLHGGNIGRKEEQRIYEAMFISDARQLSVQTGRMHQLFGSMNEKAYTTWPMMRHYKILLPLGWVMLYIRRVYRVLTGKREKMNYFKVYKDSYQRKELYQQLHIFER